MLQQVAGKMDIIVRPEAGFDIGKRGCEAGEIRLLRQITDHGPRLRENRAAVGFDLSGRDFEQGRFARSIASDERHAFAGGDGQLDAGQQRRAAEGQRDVLELKKGWCHIAVSAASGMRHRRGSSLSRDPVQPKTSAVKAAGWLALDVQIATEGSGEIADTLLPALARRSVGRRGRLADRLCCL